MSMTLNFPKLEAEKSFLSSASAEHISWTPLRNRLLAAFVVALSVLTSFFISIDKNDGVISPIDEWSYVDSMFQSAELGIVRPGEEVSKAGKDYIACQEIWGVNKLGAECGSATQPSEAWPLAGKSPAEIHPPIYFIVSALGAKLLGVFALNFDFVDRSRFFGGAWLLFGFWIWANIYRKIGASIVASTATLIIVAVSPLVVSTNTFISPDATFALSSGIVVWVSLKVLRKEASPAWLVLAGAIPVLFKVSHLLTSIQLSVLFLVLGLITKSIERKVAVLGSALLMLGTVAGLLSWQFARFLLRVGPSPVHPEEAPAITLRSFIANLGYHFTVLPQSSTSPIPVPWLSVQSTTLFSILLLGASVGGFVYFRNKSEFFAVSAVSFASVYLGAVTLSFITFVIAGGFLIPTARYGLPLLLLWTIPLVLSFSTRLGNWILLPLATVCVYAVNFGGL